MRIAAFLLATVLIFETVAAPVAAWAETVAPGARIRLTGTWPGGGRRIGSFVSAERDSIWIRSDASGESLVGTHEADVRRLEISRGKHGDGGRAAILGTLGGLAAGAVIGAAAYDAGPSWPLTRGDLATIGAVGLGLLGLVVGGIISLGEPVERWREVPLIAVRESAAAADSTK